MVMSHMWSPTVLRCIQTNHQQQSQWRFWLKKWLLVQHQKKVKTSSFQCLLLFLDQSQTCTAHMDFPTPSGELSVWNRTIRHCFLLVFRSVSDPKGNGSWLALCRLPIWNMWPVIFVWNLHYAASFPRFYK